MAMPPSGSFAVSIGEEDAPRKRLPAPAAPVAAPAPQAAPPACGVLTWEALTVTVTDAKGASRKILKRASGIAPPGELLAIMGPSGCGKRRADASHDARGSVPQATCQPLRRRSARSTLLDALAGRLGHAAALSGAVKVNGHASQLAYGRSAYVTQDEAREAHRGALGTPVLTRRARPQVLIGTLTVRETILYAARLRLRSGAGAPTPVAVAEGVLSELGLADAADTVIGNWHMRGVSGGQRRRVVLGCELVIQPTLLFLDEPTSGA